MAAVSSGTRLVTDIGGTNTRIALFDPNTGEFRALHEYLNRDFDSLPSAIEQWLSTLDEPAPREACIAAAAYSSGDLLRMVNCDWQFSCQAMASQFAWASVGWLNDFEANAHALPFLGSDDVVALQPGNPAKAAGKLAVVGPGTGFGGASLVQTPKGNFASSAEPGHMGLSPGNDLELAVFRHLLRDTPDIFVELLVSGPGLARLYRVICELEGVNATPLQPAEVASAALQATNPQCTAALTMFCALYGSACGDFILANGSWSGLYLAGGITSKILPFLEASDFLSRLREKGAMAEHLAHIPVHLVTASHPGLLGAAHATINPA